MLFLFEPPVFNSLLIIIFIVSMLVIYFIMRQGTLQPIKPAEIPKPKEQILPRPQTEEKPKAESPAPQQG